MEVLYMFLVTAFIVSLAILISLAIFKMTCSKREVDAVVDDGVEPDKVNSEKCHNIFRGRVTSYPIKTTSKTGKTGRSTEKRTASKDFSWMDTEYHGGWSEQKQSTSSSGSASMGYIAGLATSNNSQISSYDHYSSGYSSSSCSSSSSSSSSSDSSSSDSGSSSCSSD